VSGERGSDVVRGGCGQRWGEVPVLPAEEEEDLDDLE
jgi:hypothetical protein